MENKMSEGLKPGPTSMKANPMEAMRTALASLDPYHGKLKPYKDLVDSLNAELQRTHDTIRAKIESRDYHHEDDEFLKKIRLSYQDAIVHFREALDRMNGIEIRDFDKDSDKKQNDSDNIPF